MVLFECIEGQINPVVKCRYNTVELPETISNSGDYLEVNDPKGHEKSGKNRT